MDTQVLVPIKDTLDWATGNITLGDCLRNFLWDILDERFGADDFEALLNQAITIQIDGAYFVVDLKEE